MAVEANNLAGIGYLTVDGLRMDVVSGIGWAVNNRSRESLAGMDRVHGYKTKIETPFIKATIRDSAGLKVKGFQDMTDVSVTLELASGKRISGTGMWTVGVQEVNSDEATIDVRFEGPDVEED